jgi:hypothetical protein
METDEYYWDNKASRQNRRAIPKPLAGKKYMMISPRNLFRLMLRINNYIFDINNHVLTSYQYKQNVVICHLQEATILASHIY